MAVAVNPRAVLLGSRETQRRRNTISAMGVAALEMSEMRKTMVTRYLGCRLIPKFSKLISPLN
jgi:hypothetical protein